MKVCGVELTGSDAVICILDLQSKQFTIEDCKVRKLTLKKDHTREELQKFQSDFATLMSDHQVDKIAIKGRMTKGKFAGGAISFKLESAIQLIENVDTVIVSSAQIKSVLADNPLPISFTDTGLKIFQEPAFTVGYVAHSLK